jgi:hypothetical protein
MRAGFLHKHISYAKKRVIYIGLALLIASSGYMIWRPGRAHAQTDTFTTSGTWNVPAGVNSADFEAWGGGGAGGGASATNSGSGGGAGGQYAIKHLTGLVTNDAYTITVSGVTSGTTASGSAGGDSGATSPSSSQVVLAKGGAGGQDASGGSVAGTGSTTGGVGDTVFAGGNGGSGNGTRSGGGGGGAGSTGTGSISGGQSGGGATANNGGSGGTGVSTKSAGNPGNNYGGAGSGAYKTNGASQTGGSGAQGLVTVTYTISNSPPNLPTISSPANGSTAVAPVSFRVSATDPDGDSLKYIVKIFSDIFCSSGLTETGDQTVSGTGWDNGTTPYASGATATYTQQTALTQGHTYCFDVAAIDPAGSNTQSVHNSITFTVNSSPAPPSLSLPSSGATNVSASPSFIMTSTDADSDFIEYRLYLYQSDCSTPVSGSPFAETVDGTNWAGQDSGSGIGYNSNSPATFNYTGTLASSTTYCWQADAIDPGGSNTYSSTSATRLFTTAAGTGSVGVQGGVTITGGTTVQ